MTYHHYSGFVTFTSLLIISAVTIAIVMSISLLGVDEAKSSLDVKRAFETLKIADGCGEEALYRLKNDPNYAGGLLIVGDGECTINISPSGVGRTINISAQLTEANFVKKIEVSVEVMGGGLVVNSWKQIP